MLSRSAISDYTATGPASGFQIVPPAEALTYPNRPSQTTTMSGLSSNDPISQGDPSQHQSTRLGGSSESQHSTNTQCSTQETSSGSHCILTQDDHPLKCCPIVDPKAFSDMGQLEFSLGVSPGFLRRGHPSNQMLLREDLCESYIRGDWGLLPDPDTIDKIMTVIAIDFVSGTQTIYEELSHRGPREYRIIDFLEGSQDRPLSSLPVSLKTGSVVVLDIHPCLFVCDVAKKVAARGYSAPDEELDEDLQVCCGLVHEWTNTAKRVPVDLPSPDPAILSEEEFPVEEFLCECGGRVCIEGLSAQPEDHSS
ncbi:hypothetical protein RhiJN_25424 [Ceratobasidium sp. AG-Ba]|nr:hypothetical protein RhiJN_25424 [Ceratobasidium sp. AG-Ba]